MSFDSARQVEALNQNLADLNGEIGVSFEFFHQPLKPWKRLCGVPSSG